MKESLEFIYKEQKELSTLGGVAALLGWDQMTYMPPRGAAEKAEQTALISRLSHERVISNAFWEHITRLYEPAVIENLSEKDRNVIKKLHQDVEKARKIPPTFVEKMAKTTTMSYQAWEEARKKNDYKIFSPHLNNIMELEKEYCSYINLPGPRYNTLLDDYEEGMTVDRLKEEFTFLKNDLVKLLEKIKNTKVFERQEDLKIKLNGEQQRKICNTVIDKMNLPRDRFRLDVSTHPFTTSMGDDDVRITTSFEREQIMFSFFSTVHESGHALYELNMPGDEYKDTVISDSPSLGLHESQSRFWENMIARSKPFWEYFYPVFKQENPMGFKNIDLDSWYNFVSKVEPSLIRVEADELTYCLHVILRFEIETGLMDEKIGVDELPSIWNEKMDQMLGVTPKNDVEGVLQDMHWSGGSIGYFPTYAIGTIYASQIFNKISEINPEINNKIRKADFNNITEWLIENIHRYGRLFTADEIIQKACGQGLNSKVFVDYLKNKYYEIYQV